MIFKLTFKTPAVTDQLQDDPQFDTPTKMSEAQAFVGQFLEYSEFITVRLDIEANTAIVVRSIRSGLSPTGKVIRGT